MSTAAPLPLTPADRAPSCWLPAHVALIDWDALPQAPLITAGDVKPIVAGLDLWDIWPVQSPGGAIAPIKGGTLWMVLCAPKLPDPDQRHNVARIRVLHCVGGVWHDCGDLFPDGFTPGSREWSGAGLYDEATNRITAYFTATGKRGETLVSAEQRLFESTGMLDLSGELPRVTGWITPHESVRNHGQYYVDLSRETGGPRHIRGFRDPFRFTDPADGQTYLIWTASLAHGELQRANSVFRGVIGIARHDGDTYVPLPPLIGGNGLVSELERPHMFVRDGRYYVFWSSQASVFAPGTPPAPTGLYGMVADSLFGDYRPLNGSGLVITNPVAEPRQAYCWQVLDTLDVTSFIDHWGLQGRDINADPALRRAQFGGTLAPMLRIEINGDCTRLIGLAG